MKNATHFKAGDKVTWRSAAAGTWKDKTGVIVEVVQANRFPVSDIDGAISRNHVSYVVEVKNGKRKPALYWPRPNALKLSDAAGADEPYCAGTVVILEPEDLPRLARGERIAVGVSGDQIVVRLSKAVQPAATPAGPRSCAFCDARDAKEAAEKELRAARAEILNDDIAKWLERESK